MPRLFHDPAFPACAGTGCGCGGLAASDCAAPAARVVEAAVARYRMLVAQGKGEAEPSAFIDLLGVVREE